MRRVSWSRPDRTDLLVRPPCPNRPDSNPWDASVVDPLEQLRGLADLLTRGLLSREEFEREKTQILDG